MASKAEKAALEILSSGHSAYNQLYAQLEGEQAELLWKAWWECQILTIWQCMNTKRECTCQAWRDKMSGWLMNVVEDYHRNFDTDEPMSDAE